MFIEPNMLITPFYYFSCPSCSRKIIVFCDQYNLIQHTLSKNWNLIWSAFSPIQFLFSSIELKKKYLFWMFSPGLLKFSFILNLGIHLEGNFFHDLIKSSSSKLKEKPFGLEERFIRPRFNIPKRISLWAVTGHESPHCFILLLVFQSK